MVDPLQGSPQYQSGRFGIVCSRYNESITSKLLAGALSTLDSAGVPDDAVDVVMVPGAWELTVASRRLAEIGGYSALLCLGCVIQGETTHDRYINQQVSQGLGRLSTDFALPVAFGLLTCNSLEQAINRSGGNVGHKGIECAQVALEMVDLMAQIDRLGQ